MGCRPVAVYVNMNYGSKKFKSGGLHEKHVVATWSLGNHLSIRLPLPLPLLLLFFFSEGFFSDVHFPASFPLRTNTANGALRLSQYDADFTKACFASRMSRGFTAHPIRTARPSLCRLCRKASCAHVLYRILLKSENEYGKHV
jgi:hypothetical protein